MAANPGLSNQTTVRDDATAKFCDNCGGSLA